MNAVEEANKLSDHIEQLPYGSFIHYQEIEQIIGRKRKTQAYYNAIFKTKKILVTKGKAIKPVGGGDYQVLYPGDYSNAYVREVKLAKRRVKRGQKYLEGAPVNDMTDEERKVYNDISDFNTRLQAQLAGSYVEVKRLTGKVHPLAQRE